MLFKDLVQDFQNFRIIFFLPQKADGKVRMLADTGRDLAKALDVELDLSAVLGSVRNKRFSLLVDNGIVTKVNIEPDGTGMTCSLADKIME